MVNRKIVNKKEHLRLRFLVFSCPIIYIIGQMI
jgi:hypothetical protein